MQRRIDTLELRQTINPTAKNLPSAGDPNVDRVMREMKKQIICYKEELDHLKSQDAHLAIEGYQKIANDFNSLYDHYKVSKAKVKNLKEELLQSHTREQNLLQLLKRTGHYAD